MAQQDDTGWKTYEADEAIPIYSRVKLDSDGKITLADLADRSIGTSTRAAAAAGDLISIKLRSAPGSHRVRVKEAVAIGAALYSEADGEVQDTAEALGWHEGVALSASTAEDDVIEFMFATLPVVNP